MIARLVIGAARIVFNAALLALTLGLVLLYVSFRLAHSALREERGQPVREAGFALLLALVSLGKALQARLPDNLTPR